MVWQVALEPNEGLTLAAGHDNGSIVLLDTETGQVTKRFLQAGRQIFCVSWSSTERLLAFGCADGKILIGDTSQIALRRSMQSDGLAIRSVAWSRNNCQLASGTTSGRIDIWEPLTGVRSRVLEGHTGFIYGLDFARHHPILASRASDGTTKLWHTESWRLLATLPDSVSGINLTGGVAFSPSSARCSLAVRALGDTSFKIYELDTDLLLADSKAASTRFYRNAKVVVVGDTGVGKSSLCRVVCGRDFAPTESTHGRVISLLETQRVRSNDGSIEIRETLLWDLAGQRGYSPIHQLSLEDADLAVLVFDAGDDEPSGRLRYWLGMLSQSRTSRLPVILASARADLGGLAADLRKIEEFRASNLITEVVQTSSKQGLGIQKLVELIRSNLDWELLARVSSNELFHKIKTFVRVEAEAGSVLRTVFDLRRSFTVTYQNLANTDLTRQFDTCIDLMAAAGIVKRLSFGNYVLLRPEILDGYAAAILRAVREHPDQSGSIAEEDVYKGIVAIPEHQRISSRELEKPLLIATVEELKRHEIALKEGETLIFPSALSRSKQDDLQNVRPEAHFVFGGSAEALFARVAVRLSRGKSFRRQSMWRQGATFLSRSGGRCGLLAEQIPDGSGRISMSFDGNVDGSQRDLFIEYVKELVESAPWHRFVQVFGCSFCQIDFSEVQVARARELGRPKLVCPICESMIPIAVHPGLDAIRLTGLGRQHRENVTKEMDVASTIIRGKIESQDYDVFLCYNKEDQTWVRALYWRLRNAGILPWLDEQEVQPGRIWIEEFSSVINKIRVAAVFVGPRNVGKWAGVELRQLLRRFVTDGIRIIPVILPGVVEDEGWPEALNDFHRIDFRKSEPEPFAQLLWGVAGTRPAATTKS